VWEWCGDWYESYPVGEAVDPVGPESGSFRVRRGGGWLDAVGRCRSAYRSWGAPSDHFLRLGFRLAVVPSGQ